MNKILLTLCLGLLTSAIVFGQDTIQNPNFEDWSVIDVGFGITYDQVDGWDTPNQLAALLGSADRFVFEETADVQDGNSAVRLLTDSGFIPIVSTSLLVPGVITTGILGLDIVLFEPSISGGAPFTGRPSSLHGFYQYAPVGLDTAVVQVTLTKWDSGLGEQVIVGEGEFRDINSVSSWTEFAADITYSLPDDPDTILITALSSGGFGTAVQFSEMLVDNFFFPDVIGLESGQMSVKPLLYPNPADNVLQIDNPYNRPVTMEIFNILGKKMDMVGLSADLTSINTSDYRTGLYLYKISDENNVLITGKFKIVH